MVNMVIGVNRQAADSAHACIPNEDSDGVNGLCEKTALYRSALCLRLALPSANSLAICGAVLSLVGGILCLPRFLSASSRFPMLGVPLSVVCPLGLCGREPSELARHT